MERIDFGVGCLALVPSDCVDDPNSNVDWRSTIEAGVGLLPSVTQLAVEIGGITRMELSNHDILEVFARDPILDVIGHPRHGSIIRFNLTIPQRKHKELVPWLQDPISCERFEFLTLYTTEGPATFIRPLEPIIGGPRSALMVALVREFLVEQLEMADAPVTLITTGPSPYPAEFSIGIVDAESNPPEFDWIKRTLGYDAIKFYAEGVEPLETAYLQLIVKMFGRFSHYYQLVRMRDRRRVRSEIVSGLAEILVKKHSGTGLRGWFIRTFRSAKLARALMLDVIRSKQREIEEAREAEDMLSKVDTGSQLPFLEESSREEVGDGYLDVLEASQEIARTLEGNRLKSYEVFILAASTILGGAAGAIAALLAG